jgi:hypothetical protein
MNDAQVTVFTARGGGGELGHPRINTTAGSYDKASDTIESGVLTTGTIDKR